MTKAIRAENLSFSYAEDEGTIISDLSLDIGAGTLTAVLGPNGAGKTTLLHMILGLIKPGKGRLFFSGTPSGMITGEARRKMLGIVSQNNDVPFDMTVTEYVLLGRAPHKRLLQVPGEEDIKIAAQAIQTVGISHKTSAGIMALSSGERQLANVARLLAQAPSILLLDEPCSHLDLINTRHILTLMRHVVQAGKTVIFTTHDPNAAAAVADTILLIRNGQCLAHGGPEKMITEKLLTAAYGDRVEVVRTEAGPMVKVM